MKTTTALKSAVLAMTVAGSASALAAPRLVYVEQFTASWCGPCQNIGLALGQVMNDFAGDLMAIQHHIWNSSVNPGDSAWCEQRATFYGVNGIPHSQYNGTLERVGTSGSSTADYNAIVSILNTLSNTPSDLQISLQGEPLGSNQYTVTATLEADSGAPTRTYTVHLVKSLNAECGYPNAAYYYETLFSHMPTVNVTLSAGQSTTVSHTFTMNSTAAANKEFLSFTCFAQKPGSNGSADNLDIYNAATMEFSIRPPGTFLVGPGGDFSTIQAALDDAISGDVINIAPGTYDESLAFGSGSVTVQSLEGPETCIIDAGSTDAAIVMLDGGVHTIRGLTVKNGAASIGSGLRATGNVIIDNCIFRNNESSSNHVVFCLGGDPPVVSNSLFCENSHNTIFPSNWTDATGNEFIDICPGGLGCPGDVNGDGFVAVADILLVIGGWGTPSGDADGDGLTDVNDVLIVLNNFGAAC